MRLIDAHELQKRIHEHHYILRDAFNTKDLGMFTRGIDYAIQTAPTMNDVTVSIKRGKWDTWEDDEIRLYECSECHNKHWHQYNYCPSCGCIMEVSK